MPMPRITRPSEIRAAVPTALAITIGWRIGSTSTTVMKRIRFATCESAPISTSSSGHGASSANGGWPSAEYGYSPGFVSGMNRWSGSVIPS